MAQAQKAASTGEEAASRRYWCLCGMGVFWGWIICAWYTATLLPETESVGITINSNPLCNPACIVLVIALAFLLPLRRYGDRLMRPTWIALASVLLAVMTFISSFVLRDVGGTAWLLWACAVGLSIPSSLFMAAWGALCCCLNTEVAERVVPLSFLAVPLCVLACTLLPQPAALIFMALLPIVSFALYMMAWNYLSNSQLDPLSVLTITESIGSVGGNNGDQTALLTKRVVRICLTSLVLEVVLSTLLALTPYGHLGSNAIYSVFILSLAAGDLLVVLFIRFARHPDIETCYRLLPCLCALALVLFTIKSQLPIMAGAALISVAQLALDIMMYLSLSRIGAMGWSTPFTVGVLTRLSMQIGVVAGNTIGGFLLSWLVDPLGDATLLACLGLSCVIVGGLATTYDRPRYLALVDAFERRGHGEERVSSKGESSESIPNAESQFERQCEAFADHFGLTPREEAVLVLWAQGMSVPFISDQMIISRNTVDSHVKSIYRKAGVHSRDELIQAVRTE